MFRIISIAIVALVLGGCATRPENRIYPEFKGYAGEKRSNDQLAVIEGFCGWTYCLTRIRKSGVWVEGSVIFRRNGDARPTKVKLLPGTYYVRLGDYYGWRAGEIWESGNVALKAGRVYVIKSESCLFTCGPYKAALWMEDKTTGEVVLGVKEPGRY